MAIEIEHKYLVEDDSYKNMAEESHSICQGYLSKSPERTVRIRILDNKGFITVKGKTTGDSRLEFEYEIPFCDAKELIQICLPGVIEKKRYILNYCGFRWEIDEFLGSRHGLTIAEIELPSSSTPYSLPSFIGENITGNPRFYNSNL